jgi:hypothetical protein
VKEDEFDTFSKWAVAQDFMGRWMPESGDRYEMFSREYYWSPAQDYFMKEYYQGTEWTEIRDKISREYIAEVNVTAQGFMWEEEFDKSKEQTISFLKPSRLIYDGMKLRYSLKEGYFVNDADVVECLAPDVYHDTKSYLLVKRIPFLKFLEQNKLRIVWTVLGEKQIIGGHSNGREYFGRVEISGAFYFDGSEFTGKLNSKIISDD